MLPTPLRLRAAAAAVALATLFADATHAQELDADIQLGDQFKGEILHNADVDVLRFSTLQSALVTITVESTSKVKPYARVRNVANGAFVDTVPFEKGLGSKKFVIKKLPIPETGSYEIQIQTANNKSGKYKVKTKVKYPNTITKVKTFLSMAAGETKTVKLLSDEGWKITGLIKPGKNSAALPSVTSLNTPSGVSDISGFVVQKGKKLKIKKLFTDELGEYFLSVQNVGQLGEIVVDLEVTPVKINKIKWKEPSEPKDPGSIAGDVNVADLMTLPETEPNDSIADTEFVGLSFPGKNITISGITSDNGFPGGNGGGPLASADLDSFRIQVDQPQAVHLTLVHNIQNDFDIGVWDVNAGQWVGFIETANEPEIGSMTVTPPAGQSMLLDVIVYSYSGTGSYILSLNAAPPPATGASNDGEEEEPGVVLDAPTGKGVAPGPAGTERFLQLDRDFRPGEFILCLRDLDANQYSFAADQGLFVKLASPTGPALVRIPGIESLPPESRRMATVVAAEKLRNHPDVLYTQLNFILQPTAIPNDPNYAQQWHYPAINLPQAWDITKGSQNVIVAVLDTGVVPHPDLVARDTGTGYDMISDPEISVDDDGIDPDPTDPGDKKTVNGKSSWHGTHVAGTIGASTNNGQSVSGVDWNCRLMHMRVLGKGGGLTFDINEAIKYAAGVQNVSGTVPPKKANIINMSLGANGTPGPADQQAIDLAHAQGVVIFGASGNTNNGGPQNPASANHVIAVGATDQSGERAVYSNYGSYLDIVAPGGDVDKDPGVISTFKDDASGAFISKGIDGTSMACPHAAGVAALLLSVNPNLTPEQVENLLTSTAIDIGTPGKDDFTGHGRIDAFKAVQAAGGGANPVMSLSTTSLDYGTAINTLGVTVSNTGGGNLTWNATDDADWLDLTPTTGGPMEVLATVDRGVLLPGVYNGTISFTSNGGNAQVAVKMEVGAGNGPASLTVSTEALNFGEAQTLLKVELGNKGALGLNWNATDSENGGGNWLSITPTNGSIQPNQTQSMTVTVDRTGLAQGAYSGKVTINADGEVPKKEIAIAMVVPQSGNPVLSLSAANANFGANLTTFPVMVNNAGGGALNYTASDTENGGGTWLNVTPTAGAAPATLDITVDRTGLAAGIYTGVVNVNSNGGNAVINVHMEVLPKDQVPLDQGNIYVLAIDPITFETRAQAVVTQFDGAYNLNGLPVGLYLMVAGPDLDDDFFICGPGEPCGVYTSPIDPTFLDLTGGQILLGINFTVAPDVVLPASGTGAAFVAPPGGFPIQPGSTP